MTDDSDGLVAYVHPRTIAHLPRAGDVAAQIALSDAAWEMMEVYTTGSGDPGTRFSNAWLGDHDWSVHLMPYSMIGMEEESAVVACFVAAARRRFVRALFGTGVDARTIDGKPYRPNAVWRVPMLAREVELLANAHYATFHLIFAPDRGFAIHCDDGAVAVVAGPEPFLREALPPDFLGAAATETFRREMEHEYGEGALDALLNHYAAFMLTE